jgi:ketosteroid isomerase-like protein
MDTKKTDDIEAVVRAWETALAKHDADTLLACYAPDATLESRVAAHILGGKGVVRDTANAVPAKVGTESEINPKASRSGEVTSACGQSCRSATSSRCGEPGFRHGVWRRTSRCRRF